MNNIGLSERATQDRVIQLFREELGYTFLGNWSTRSRNSNIEEALLTAWLTKRGHSPQQISQALQKLHTEADNFNHTLYGNNEAVYTLLRYGVPVKTEVGKPTETVMLIDWKRPEANDSDLAPRSIARLEFAASLLMEHFGADRHMDSVTVGDAEGYSRWLSQTRASNTVRRQVGWAKQFFGAAVKHELLLRNPFAGLAANTRSRDHFVFREELSKLLEACPDCEWRQILTLCRYAGRRCPTEVLALRWSDILWDQDRMTITNIKTGKTKGEAFRVIPLFPEVRVCLDEAFDLASEGAEYVINRYRDCNANLRTQLGRIA